MFYRGAASRCRRRPPTATTIAAAAAPRFVLAGLRSSSTPAVATSSPSSIALSSSVAPARRTYTFRARRSDDDGVVGGMIDPAELCALNATSAKLYRLLLRSSRSLVSSVDDGDGRRTEEEGEVRLQSPLDPRDYGRARLIDCRPQRSSTSAATGGGGGKTTDEAETTAPTRSLWNFVEGRLGPEGPSNSESAFVRRRFADLAGSDAADGSDADSDGSDDEEEGDASMATTSSDVRSAIRRSFFRLDGVGGDPSSSSSPLTKRDVVEMHRLAISTLRVVHEQIEMKDRTSVSTDERRGLKVIATSQCIGKTASSPRSSDDETTARYRFAYRIRIENVGRRARKCDDDANDDADGTKHKEGDVQLLGRTWKIEEDGEAGEVVHVDAPKTGAVGHHPVILPGQAFEYMSGCELQTKTGRMSGKFHMASVDGGNTFSAMVGDVVEALDESDDENDDDDSKKFEIVVKPFRLVASDE